MRLSSQKSTDIFRFSGVELFFPRMSKKVASVPSSFLFWCLVMPILKPGTQFWACLCERENFFTKSAALRRLRAERTLPWLDFGVLGTWPPPAMLCVDIWAGRHERNSARGNQEFFPPCCAVVVTGLISPFVHRGRCAILRRNRLGIGRQPIAGL